MSTTKEQNVGFSKTYGINTSPPLQVSSVQVMFATKVEMFLIKVCFSMPDYNNKFLKYLNI